MAKRRVQMWWRPMIVCVIIIGLAAAGLAFCWHRHKDPQRAFWNMLANSLSTSSVTRKVEMISQDGKQQQVTRLSLGGQAVAQGQTIVTQSTPAGLNTVTTETIGTLQADFARYVTINTPQRGADNQPLSFDNILGVWGRSNTAPQFLGGNILNVIPFAPLSAPQRRQVLQTMRDKKVYMIDFGKVTSRREQGRSTFVYKVSVNASAYVSMLKTLAQQLGMKQLDTVDPAAYAQSAPEEFEITVDKLSNQLLSATYSGGLRTETYSGYGLQARTSIPKQAIPIPELQRRLQSIQ